MNITFIPTKMSSNSEHLTMTHAILFRKEVEPRVILSDIVTSTFGDDSVTRWVKGIAVDGFQPSDLQDGDIIFYPSNRSDLSPLRVEIFAGEGTITPFKMEPTISSMAAGMESNSSIIMTTTPRMNQISDKAVSIFRSLKSLYAESPKYKSIMMKENGEIVSRSLAGLVAQQDIDTQKELEVYLLSLASGFMGAAQRESAAQKVLNEIPFAEYFQLLTEEEQVGHFIEFSKMSSAQKKEYVPDTLIDAMKRSPEYARTLAHLEANGLGISKTQQFNVLQQVGYFSHNHLNKNILYNLSDMGAGKTLMTVQAIAMLDMKQLSNYLQGRGIESESTIFRTPDKHIITPTLSVKSSWIDTFKMFYDVVEVNDTTYNLSMEYDGYTLNSQIHVAPFTIKNSLLYVGDKLPIAQPNTYLIIDEIHQLVKRNIAKTKFFPPATDPVSIYKSFILSGTMSNLLSREWLTFMRFMGIPITTSTATQAKEDIISMRNSMKRSTIDAISSIRTAHRRQVDTDDITPDNIYALEPKKMTSINEQFFTRYGVQVVSSPFRRHTPDDKKISFEQYMHLLDSGAVTFQVDEDEFDTTNFQLFYDIVGSQSITAQSQTIAEELFGEQSKQHISDIIKTASPLTSEDIQILKALHHIAEGHSHYKSLRIAKMINTAILNLNDGLQTKNIYDILSNAAEKNIRFFEYLTTLDINVLEKLPQSNLIKMPKLEDTEKFKILQDILRREKNETHLIVVNDFHAMTALSKAIGVTSITRAQLRDELSYQDTLDDLFEKQSIVVVTQDMIKSSLDLVQANRLIQYQLNTEISDIIQTQNRINRIGQTRETRGYYIASDALQENLIDLFLASYQNIRVAHKGIVELFVDVSSQINIVNNYLAKAFETLDADNATDFEDSDLAKTTETTHHVVDCIEPTDGIEIASENNITNAILYPVDQRVQVIVPTTDGASFLLGYLSDAKMSELKVHAPVLSQINLETLEVSLS